MRLNRDYMKSANFTENQGISQHKLSSKNLNLNHYF
jgi:hypothetical protein